MPKKKPEKSLDELLEEALVKEDEQPYEVPGNWVFTKLGSICTKPQYGWTTKAKQEGDVYLVRTTDITSDNLDWQNVPYCSEVPKDLSKYLLKEDDIVISRAGSIGVSYLIEKPKKAVFASYLIRFNPIINKKYVYLFLKSPIYWSSISEKSSGIALPNINATKLGEIRFPLPPLTEQKRIVKKLSSMLGKLKEARELIKEARNTFEERRAAILNKAFTGELTKKWREENPDVELELSMIQEIEKKPFDIPSSWKWARLQDVCSRFQYGTSAKSSKEGKVPVVRMGNIQNGIISWENLVYTSNDKEIDQYNLNYNDVLFNRTNSPALVGKTAIYKGEMPAIYAGYLIRVKPQDKLNADFLNFFLNSPYARYKCNRVKTDGVSQSNINSKKLGNFEVPLPPLEEQQEIVQILKNLLDHENEARALIDMEEKIDLLEKSILPKAFRGELDTNDTNDEPAIELLKKSLKEKMNK